MTVVERVTAALIGAIGGIPAAIFVSYFAVLNIVKLKPAAELLVVSMAGFGVIIAAAAAGILLWGIAILLGRFLASTFDPYS